MTRHRQPRRGTRPPREWVAADLRFTPDGTFLLGTLGYSEDQEHITFDARAWSWIKGRTQQANTGTGETVVPFALDLREQERWLAFAVATRLQPKTFCSGLERVLDQAVADLGFIGTAWEVDLITSEESVYEWLRDNPSVHALKRTVKFTNPGRRLDGDREQMHALAARRKTEEYAARPNRTLDTRSAVFADLIDGIDTGDIELVLRARGETPDNEPVFRSVDRPDEQLITDYGRDLEAGMDLVLRVLVDYTRPRRADGPAQGALLPD